MHSAEEADGGGNTPRSFFLSQSVATLLIPGTGLTIAEWVDRDNGPLIISNNDPLFREWLGRLRSEAADMLVTDPHDNWPISGSVIITHPVCDGAGHEVIPPVIAKARNSIAVVCTNVGSELLRNAGGLSSARPDPASPDRAAVASNDSAVVGDAQLLRTMLWNLAMQRLNGVREEFAAYESDPTAFFHRPLLADRTHPVVQGFYAALSHADALRIDDMVPADLGYVRDFADRAAAAETAWRAANSAALISGDSDLSTEQRALLRRAESAIKLALDDRTPPNERAAAYARVVDLFGKARISVPHSITATLRQQIASATRLELPRRSC